MKIKSVITLVATSTLMMSSYSVMAGVCSNINSDITAQQRGSNTATANTGASRYGGRYGSASQYNTATAQAGVGNIDIDNTGRGTSINSTIRLQANVNHQGNNTANASTPSGHHNKAVASAGFGNVVLKNR
jgi:hypothetical protein